MNKARSVVSLHWIKLIIDTCIILPGFVYFMLSILRLRLTDLGMPLALSLDIDLIVLNKIAT